MLRLALLLSLAPVIGGAEDRGVRIPGTELILALPTGWTSVRPPDGAALTLYGPAPATADDEAARERARPIVAVTVVQLTGGNLPAGLGRDALKDLERLLARFDPINDEPYPRTIAGRQWYYLHYTCEIGQIPWEQELWMGSSGKVMLYIACSCDHTDFAAHRGEFSAMIASLGASRPSLEPKP
jgi:hypothetical protein